MVAEVTTSTPCLSSLVRNLFVCVLKLLLADLYSLEVPVTSR